MDGGKDDDNKSKEEKKECYKPFYDFDPLNPNDEIGEFESLAFVEAQLN